MNDSPENRPSDSDADEKIYIDPSLAESLDKALLTVYEMLGIVDPPSSSVEQKPDRPEPDVDEEKNPLDSDL